MKKVLELILGVIGLTLILSIRGNIADAFVGALLVAASSYFLTWMRTFEKRYLTMFGVIVMGATIAFAIPFSKGRDLTMEEFFWKIVTAFVVERSMHHQENPDTD